MSDECSESGDPIHRYDEPAAGWVPPNLEDSSLKHIEKHIKTHVGKIDTVYHELMSHHVHIDMHQVAPTAERPYWTLITSGMSDLPMPAPKGSEAWRYAELMICLPQDWPITGDEAGQEDYAWATRWLKMLARFPHEYQAWMAWGHTMPNGDPPEPFCAGVDFAGIILLEPKTVSRDFWSLKVCDDKTIHFYSVVPIYEAEMNLKLKQGSDHLNELFEKHKVTELVDVDRPNLALGR